MKKYIITAILALGLCILALSGGDSWRRKATSVTEPTTAETQSQSDADTEIEKEDMEEDSEEETEDILPSDTFEEEEGPVSEDDIQEKTKIVPVKASLSSQEDEVLWSTEDDLHSKKLYDILNHKAETISEEELDACDYIILIEDDKQEEYCYLVWGSLSAEEQMLVENDIGECWKLSEEDSNHLRSIINGL